MDTNIIVEKKYESLSLQIITRIPTPHSTISMQGKSQIKKLGASVVSTMSALPCSQINHTDGKTSRAKIDS